MKGIESNAVKGCKNCKNINNSDNVTRSVTGEDQEVNHRLKSGSKSLVYLINCKKMPQTIYRRNDRQTFG